MFSFVFFCSCENSELEIKSPESPTLTLDLEMIGDQHNAALSETFRKLKNTPNLGELKREEFIATVNDGLGRYYLNTYAEDVIPMANECSKREVEKYLGVRKVFSERAKTEDSSPLEQVIAEQAAHLTTLQIEMIRKCDNILKNGSSAEDILAQFDLLESQIRNELTESEAQIVLVGIQIGKSSTEYWSENYSQWRALNGQTERTEDSWLDDAEDIIGADVGGAVGGATVAFVANAVPVAGQVAYGTAIITGAAGSSAGAAALNIWNEIFD